jgi:hypothetical protein
VVHPKNIRVMGHHGKDTTSPKEDMVDLKCSRLSNSQSSGRHPQLLFVCLQYWLETFQSIARHLPALLHLDKFPVHLGDLPLASQSNDFSQLRNRARQMLQGLRICPHYQRFCMTILMKMLGAMIRQT